MKTIYVIKDVKTNTYYWSYKTNEGFYTIEESTKFNSEEDAIKELKIDYLSDFFQDRILEIKKLYSFE